MLFIFFRAKELSGQVYPVTHECPFPIYPKSVIRTVIFVVVFITD